MPLFERRLVAPTDAELADALRQAERAAGATAAERHYRGGPEDFVRAARPLAEGLRVLVDGIWALFAVAWWTDHLGRRHYRLVVAGPEDDGGRQFRAPDGERPALWYVYPERVYRRTREGRAEWLAGCACGACGPPGRLAWMGPCCGPCHDRVEEGAAPLPAAVLGGPPGPVHSLAFAPDGRALAAAKEGRQVEVFDLGGGGARVLVPRGGHPNLAALAFSPDGAALAAGSTEGEVLLYDVATGECRLRSQELGGHVRDVAFSPDGRVLAACSGRQELGVWVATPGGGWECRRHSLVATALAFAPRGDVLALGRPGGRVSLFDPRRWSGRRGFSTGAPAGHDVRLAAFTPDGQTLLTLSGRHPDGDTAFDTPRNFEGRLQAWGRDARELSGYRSELPPFTGAALSPDRAWLAWFVYDQRASPAAVTFWDVAAGRVCGSLEWDADDAVYCLAFSPDGRLLATGGQSGTVKLWPWRELLEA
jgi:WD40 repeat protein